MEREPVSAGTAVDLHAAPPCGEREGKEAGGRRFRLQGNSKKIWARLTAHPWAMGSPSEESCLPVLVPLFTQCGCGRGFLSTEAEPMRSCTPHSGRPIWQVRFHGHSIRWPLAASSWLHLLQGASTWRLGPELVPRARQGHSDFEALYEFSHKVPDMRHLLSWQLLVFPAWENLKSGDFMFTSCYCIESILQKWVAHPVGTWTGINAGSFHSVPTQMVSCAALLYLALSGKQNPGTIHGTCQITLRKWILHGQRVLGKWFLRRCPKALGSACRWCVFPCLSWLVVL